MHTAQLLSHAIGLARRVGYSVREEALEGAGGGHCVIRDQKWLLLDLTQTHQEQFNDVLDALRCETSLDWSAVPEGLIDYLRVPRAA